MSDLDIFNESDYLENFTKATPEQRSKEQYNLFYNIHCLNNHINKLAAFFQNDFQQEIESGEVTENQFKDDFKDFEFLCDNLCRNLDELKKIAKCQIDYFINHTHKTPKTHKTHKPEILTHKLAMLKELQDTVPSLYIGGSMGLLLHGVDLQRDLWASDFDLIMDKNHKGGLDAFIREMDSRSGRTLIQSDNAGKGSTATDFDLKLVLPVIREDIRGTKSVVFVKTEIRFLKNDDLETPDWVSVTYKGIRYRVQNLKSILKWKKKYADDGYEKHQVDLKVIETGLSRKTFESGLPF